MVMKTESQLMDRIVTAAVMGLLAWNVYTTQQLSVEVAVISSKLNTNFVDIYTGSQALARAEVVNRRLDRLESWNQNLTDRLAKVEEELRDILKNQTR